MAAPPSAFHSMRAQNEILFQQQQQQLIMPPPPLPQPPPPLPPPPPPAQPQPPDRRRRNQPGNPSPDAEVIALSPKALMTTNRFVCEVCQKGFQREQNLQLHRRGHNLPWNLRKSTNDVKRKVYICPELDCAHHDPTRALGDLTGIKKHYLRKHGEKNYKCEKCTKKYAVQSDCKAHSKTCGTREYMCDCGTLFSRRDSFVTHRTFCDQLAQVRAQHLNAPSFSNIGSPLLGFPGHTDHQIDHLHQLLSNQDLLRLSRLDPQYRTIVGPGFGHSPSPQGLTPSSSAAAGLLLLQHVPNHEEDQHEMQLPLIQMNNANGSSSSTPGLFNPGFFPGGSNAASGMDGGHHSGVGEYSSHFFSSGNLMSMTIPSLYSTPTNPIQTLTGAHMSATAPSLYSTPTNPIQTLTGAHMSATAPSLYSTPTNSIQTLTGAHMSATAPSLYSTPTNPIQTPTGAHMSATTLLQNAAQSGSTTTNNTATSPLFQTLGKSSSSDGHSFGVLEGNHLQPQLLHDLLNSMTGGGSGASSASMYGGLYSTDYPNHDHDQQDHTSDDDNDYGGFSVINHNHNKILFDDHNQYHQQHQNSNDYYVNQSGLMRGLGQSGRLTRDFLGMGEIVMNVGEQHNGVVMSALDHSQGTSRTFQSHIDQSFGGGSF